MRPAEGCRSICLRDLLGQCCVRYSLRSRTAHSPENRSDVIAGIPGDPWGNKWSSQKWYFCLFSNLRSNRDVGEVGTEKWGVDNVDSRFAQRIAPHDTHDDVSSLATEERELSNGHAGGDVATVAHFSCGPTTVIDSFS
eukprot:scaffold3825_cov131-Cylindrotheca_fusiformis.AAC.4